MWATSVAKLARRGRMGDLTWLLLLLLLLLLLRILLRVLVPRAGEECITRRERAVSSSVVGLDVGDPGGGGAAMLMSGG